MSTPVRETTNHQARIDKFDNIIARCEQEAEELRRNSRNQDPKTRFEQAKLATQGLLATNIFTARDDIIESRKKFLEDKDLAGPKVSFATDVPNGDRDDHIKSKEGYASSKVFRILDSEMKEEGRKDVKLSNMVFTGNAADKEQQGAFNGQLRTAMKAAQDGKATIMPIHLNLGNCRHWVGGMLRQDPDNPSQMQFIYNDPQNSPGEDNIDATLAKWIKAFDPNINIVNLQVDQQKDGYNCGAHMVDNLLKFADNSRSRVDELKAELSAQVNAEELRQKHGDVLAKVGHDRDEAQELWSQVKERAICGKMQDLYSQFEKSGRKQKGSSGIKCDDDKSAALLAEQIKQSYEDLGVKPCRLEKKGEVWVVKLPEACKGRDPFAMKSEDLKELREELKEPSTASRPKSAKGVAQERRGVVDALTH